MERPDFERLRAERDANTAAAIKCAVESIWGPEAAEKVSAHVSFGGGTSKCYCACADGGPCEHQFSGWREFEDGCGGEQFCERCGMGAMSHSMHTCWE